MAKYISLSSGVLTEVQAATSGGAPDANKIAQLDSNGKWPIAMMPSGIAADTKIIVASEALSAGDLVNVYNNAGTPTCRKADATSTGKEAHGFVLSAVSSSANATVYFEGTNDQLTSLTAGNLYLATTAGAVTATPPSSAGNVVQRVGVAVSATELKFEAEPPITLA